MKELSLYAVELDTDNHGYIEMLVDITYFYNKEGEFHHNSASDLDYHGYSEIEWVAIQVDGCDENGEQITIDPSELNLTSHEDDKICNMLIELKLAEG